MNISNISQHLGLQEKEVIKCLDTQKNRALGVLYLVGGAVCVKNADEILEKFFNYSSLVFLDPKSKKTNLIPFDKEPRVYFLLMNDEVVYIGQTIQIAGRIASHTHDKKFDYVSYIDTKDNDLDLVEAFNIALHRPPLNVSIPSKLDLLRMVTSTIG